MATLKPHSSGPLYCNMVIGYKAEWKRDSAHFLLITMTGYRSHAVRRLELVGYFVRFGRLFHC